jgi:ATP-dependent Clp protease protease subunit
MNNKNEDFGKAEDKYLDDYYFRILNKNRYLLLYADIEPCAAEIIVAKIKAMNYMDSESPITIEIDSPGGSVSAGISIINAMEQSKAPIITIISAEACSMAAMISIIGKHRIMYHNAFWMNHPISEGQVDYLGFIKDRCAFLNKLEDKLYQIMKKYTNLTDVDINKMKTGELWLGADEALTKSVVDEII